MTFAEFERLPDLPGSRYELRHGKPVQLMPPNHGLYVIRENLRRLLENFGDVVGAVSAAMPFRPLPDHEFWLADVAFIRKQRWDLIPLDGNLAGAPELVVEVISPSTIAMELNDKRFLCLENGSCEFWVVSAHRRSVEVSTSDGHGSIYKSGQEIPLFFAPGARIAVDEIFKV